MRATIQPSQDGRPFQPVYSTLLELVQNLLDEKEPEDDVALSAANLVNSGQVVLTGNFKGCRMELS